jgi:hypothetical protein
VADYFTVVAWRLRSGVRTQRTTAWEDHYRNPRTHNPWKLVSLCICHVTLYLQRPDLNRRLREKAKTPSTSPVGAGPNWLSWLLSAYVAQEFGIANGMLFFILAMGAAQSQTSLSLDCHASIGFDIQLALQPRFFWFEQFYGRSAFRPSSKNLAYPAGREARWHERSGVEIRPGRMTPRRYGLPSFGPASARVAHLLSAPSGLLRRVRQ